MKRITSLALPIALLTSAPAWARSDEQLWTTAGVNVKLSPDWRLSEELVARFSDNRNGLYEIEATTMLGYRLNKTVTIAGGYVHNPQYAGGDFTVMEHRAREQVSFDNFAKLGSGKLSARMRLEQRWREGVDGTGWRARPYLKYSIPLKGKTAFNVSNETFVNLNTTTFQKQDGIDRMRNLFSISTPLTKSLNGEAGYMNQYGFVRHGDDTVDHAAYFAVTLNL
jgi:hypothetical protein